ncbi:MAG TPA: NADH-quinone oxidoreductase subunit A [Candidatus Bathyarchaeia archaeon]|nr:NADH-quinone oxidoreductase subunit A [Candidatus Bathyarchaeia archaeon]
MAGLLVDTNTIIAFVLALAAGFGFGLVGYAVSRLVAPPKPMPLKNERFECGNPPTKQGRGQLTMQYFAYLVVFLTVEPVFIYSFLLLMDAHQAFFSVVELFSLILLMLIPPLIFGLDSAKKIHLWQMREDPKK